MTDYVREVGSAEQGRWEQMGIRPLNISVWEQPTTPLLRYALQGLLASNEHCGGITSDVAQADGVILVPSRAAVDVEEAGVFGLPSTLRRRVKAFALSTISAVEPATNLVRLGWTLLANKATHYGILFVGDEQRAQCESAFMFSMEGSHTHTMRDGVSEQQFFDSLIARMTHLAGAEVVSDWEVDYSLPQDAWSASTVPQAVIESGRKLRAWALLPDVQLGQYASPRRTEQIKLYLEVSGLTVGNMSAWDEQLGAMQITGSGVDKGNLKREEVIAIRSLNAMGNGCVVWVPPGTRRVKPSVEAFDHLLSYSASSLLASGAFGEYRLLNVLAQLNARDLAARTQGRPPFFRSMIHLHLWPERVLDHARVHRVEVEPQLFQYHSSCGTRPLALYSVEALLRGMVETNYAPKMSVVGLPNHGLLAASPLPLEAMTELFNPERPTLEFGDIPML